MTTLSWRALSRGHLDVFHEFPTFFLIGGSPMKKGLFWALCYDPLALLEVRMFHLTAVFTRCATCKRKTTSLWSVSNFRTFLLPLDLVPAPTLRPLPLDVAY